MRFSSVGSACVAIVVTGCAIIPDVPPDFALPIQEILSHTACELRDAFRSLNTKEYRRFKATEWLITVSLLPKANTAWNIGGGWTRKNPFVGSPTTFTTWQMTGPGIQYDAKGERSSAVNYKFKSAELIADKKLICPATPSAHVLAQHLGVGAWLRRSAAALEAASSAAIDKPTYNTDITIKLAANGSYTFTFPPGTNLASLGGSYSLDEQLNIGMAPTDPKPKELTVISLPAGQNLKDDGRPPEQKLTTSTSSVEAAQSRLDLLQLEQAIRSLQTRP